MNLRKVYSISKLMFLPLVMIALSTNSNAEEKQAQAEIQGKVAVQINLPSWVKTPLRDKSSLYVVGEAKEIESKEDALERAWISALLRIGMTQFPELGTLQSQSNESLHDANYQRQFVLKLEKLSWEGLREMEELGSPFVTFNEDTKSYTVFRLLKWSKADVEASRKKVHKNINPALPASPEVMRKNEEDMISEVRQLHELNRKIDNRDVFVGRVLRNAKCGIKISDLIRILGPADREGAYNESALDPEYFWGTYRVKHWKNDPSVYSIATKNGGGNERILCSNY